MIAVIQRVSSASVTISEKVTASIQHGLLVLVGIETADTQEDIEWLTSKIAKLRVFNDENGVMNLDVTCVNGEAIVERQFTLHASTRKGNRPSYTKAARPDHAVPLYESFIKRLNDLLDKPVQTGEFGADMKVALVNDGPVTIIIDTKNKT